MTDTTLKTLTLRPGIQRDLSPYQAEGGWVDCDKIRFYKGRARKLSGWVKETLSQATNPSVTTFTGVPRQIQTWVSLSGTKYTSVGSHSKVEIVENSQIYDITPIKATYALNNVVTTNATNQVKITHAGHGLLQGDFIYVNSQATAVNGVTLSGSYEVTSVVDANNYYVTYTSAASGSTALAGGAFNVSYLLETGLSSNAGITGFGGGLWSASTWGTPRTSTTGLYIRQWSFDNWGEDLIACMRNGKIYQWVKASGVGTRLQVVSGAPTQNLVAMISQSSRQLIAFGSQAYGTGTFDPLIIRWSDIESLTTWNITDTNSAGEYRLPSGSYIVGVVQTKGEILVFTDSDVYSMTFVGGTDVYQFKLVAPNCGLISQNAVVDINGTVYWLGMDNFYKYTGVVETFPSTANTRIFSFDDGDALINYDQKEKTYVGVDKEFNEIFFFYPANTNTENSHYMKYNFYENAWDFGVLSRTAWEDKHVFTKPYALDATGKLYAHDVGYDDDGKAFTSYITSAYFDIDDGEQFTFLDRVVPDVTLPSNKGIFISVFVKKYPHPNATVVTKGPYPFNDTNTKIGLRARGRHMAIKFSSEATGGDFDLGIIRVGFQPDGER